MTDADADVLAFLNLDLEFRLTIALRLSQGGCFCPQYLVDRRDVLFAEILKKAKTEDRDSDDVFHEFAQKLHAQKCE